MFRKNEQPEFSEYDVTKDDRQWLETVTALYTCICYIPHSLSSLCEKGNVLCYKIEQGL